MPKVTETVGRVRSTAMDLGVYLPLGAYAAINTIRFLSVDMVEKAQSGHPGAPLGQAPRELQE